jgi:hypothetical protein
MNQPPIKLLAVDIDGTLLDSKYKITSATREAISKAVRQGVIVTLVTGRRFLIARPFAVELGLTTPLILHNGALIKDVHTLEVWHYDPLEQPPARQVIELAREHEIDIICSDDPHGPGRLVAERISADNQPLERYLSHAPEPPMIVADLCRYVDHDVINMMTVDRFLKAERFAEALLSEIGMKVKILKTAYPERDMTVLDVMARDCTKAKALDVLVRRFNLTPAEVMAVGDNQNDLDMLEYAGLGIVMGNADEEIKKLGYYVTASNEDNGLALAISEFLLGEPVSF